MSPRVFPGSSLQQGPCSTSRRQTPGFTTCPSFNPAFSNTTRICFQTSGSQLAAFALTSRPSGACIPLTPTRSHQLLTGHAFKTASKRPCKGLRELQHLREHFLCSQSGQKPPAHVQVLTSPLRLPKVPGRTATAAKPPKWMQLMSQGCRRGLLPSAGSPRGPNLLHCRSLWWICPVLHGLGRAVRHLWMLRQPVHPPAQFPQQFLLQGS